MTSSTSLVDRMIRAAKLEVQLYEEVEADEGATTQAFWIVVLASIAAGIGSAIATPWVNLASAFFIGIIWSGALGILGWLVWALATYLIGTKLLAGPETRCTYSEMLRVLGFANAPGVLRILGFIPLLGGLIGLATAIWTLIAGVVAIRHALDFTTERAVAAVIIGWFAFLFLTLMAGATIGGLMFLLFA